MPRYSASKESALRITAVLTIAANTVFSFLLCAGPPQNQSQPRTFKVLDSQEVDLGPRSIIYNLVETSALLPQPAPTEKSTAPAVEPTPTAEELAEMQ